MVTVTQGNMDFLVKKNGLSSMVWAQTKKKSVTKGADMLEGTA